MTWTWLDVDRLRSNVRPSKLCSVDIETTGIKVNHDIDLVWCISWCKADTMEVTSIHWEKGIDKALLKYEFDNAATKFALSGSAHDMKLLELRNILAGETEYVPSFHNCVFEKMHLGECVPIPAHHDTMLMLYVLIPPAMMGSTGEEDAMRFYSLSYAGKLGLCSAKLDFSSDWDKFTPELLSYNRQDAKAQAELSVNLFSMLVQDPEGFNAYCVDLCMADLIIRMERRGVKVDAAAVSALLSSKNTELSELLSKIDAMVPATIGRKPKKFKRKPQNVVPISATRIYPRHQIGCYVLIKDEPGNYEACEVVPFNPGSDDQLAQVLVRQGWEPKTYSKKTGLPSVDKKALSDIADTNALANLVLQYRQLTKLTSTYLKPFSLAEAGTDRMYPSFLLTATRTGRLSSRSPNFQNIPTGDIRSLVVAEKGYSIVVIDLSQIELRILAWYMAKLLGTPQAYYLWNLYGQGADVHAANAEKIGCVRKLAKIAIFLYIYGGGVSRFASSLGISYLEARQYYTNLEREIEALPQLKSLVMRVVREKKFIRTKFGHRIQYPNLFSSDRSKAQEAERQIFNALIQGGQADILKVLAWQMRHAMTTSGAEIIIQVHDELVYEVPTSNAGYFAGQLYDKFNNRVLLPGLPVLGIPGVGDSWLSAKKDAEAREQAVKDENNGRLLTS